MATRPLEHGRTGKRAFFVNQDGEVLACANEVQRYSGTTKAPVAGQAAFTGAGTRPMDGKLARNEKANDGENWSVAN